VIQIKEFIDSDVSLAEKSVNEFLSRLREDQFIDIRFGTFTKKQVASSESQRSAILVIYRVDNPEQQ
jgi:hypothetical protein